MWHFIKTHNKEMNKVMDKNAWSSIFQEVKLCLVEKRSFYCKIKNGGNHVLNPLRSNDDQQTVWFESKSVDKVDVASSALVVMDFLIVQFF